MGIISVLRRTSKNYKTLFFKCHAFMHCLQINNLTNSIDSHCPSRSQPVRMIVAKMLKQSVVSVVMTD